MTRLPYLLAILALLLCAPASAHQRSTSYATWDLDLGRVDLRLPSRALSRAGIHPLQSPAEQHEALRAYLLPRLSLARGGQSCRDAQLTTAPQAGPWQDVHVSWRCPETGPWRLQSRVLIQEDPGHLQYASVQIAGQALQRVFSAGHTEWQLTADPSTTRSWWWQGVIHILRGWDHLAFLLGLLLICQGWRELLWLVTGFSLGHSGSLIAATLGWVDADSQAIEALIGWSILLVAAEPTRPARHPPVLLGLGGILLLVALAAPSFWSLCFGLALFGWCYFQQMEHSRHPARWRLVLTLAFGLIHGFGFAGQLAELGPEAARSWPVLLGFNLGVECGQLLVVLLVWPMLGWLRARALALEPTLLGLLGALGSYWFALRLLA